MATRSDGTKVPHAEALELWADAAYEHLREMAATYNETTTYAALRRDVAARTQVTSAQQLNHWSREVLLRAARRAAESGDPPLTSLCVRDDGTIGPGYREAPTSPAASGAADIEMRAAEDRLLCYRRFARDVPADGGRPTLTPEVAFARRDPEDDAWLEELISRGRLTVGDRVRFRTHVEVARLFGRDYRAHQQARIGLDETTEVWFPKMYANADWHNTLSDDGHVITMRRMPEGRFGDATADDRPRYSITFGHVKPASGPRHYRFLGVFEHARHLSDADTLVRQRVADVLTFDGTEVYDFSVSRTRPVLDDATAEAAAPDPALLSEARRRLEAGDYAVPDQERMTAVRGSYQSAFAERVKGNYGWECAVTGIETREFLIASHIVPWSEDPSIRLDPTNGICLSTFVDRAFDAGFLDITPEGRTRVRWDRVDDAILKVELTRIDGVELKQPTREAPDPVKLRRRLGS